MSDPPRDPFMPTDPAELDGEEPPIDEDDPLLEELIADALRPYLAALSPEQIADYRAFLAIFFTTHPAVAPRYERLRDRQRLKASSTMGRGGTPGDKIPPAAASRERK